MSDRKVLNKYYPPDFDPTKIPKQKRNKNQTFDIRLMAPFNMRCNTCGEYIYKGKKFNSRKETVDNENYLGLYIFRFYIKCPRCVAEIAFKTDPENTDYTLEAGATRNFEALRTAEKQAILEDKLKKAEEANNPMKLLENRTKASQNEMQLLETLEDLKQLNQRSKMVNTEDIIKKKNLDFEAIAKNQELEDEDEIKNIYRNHIKRLPESNSNIDITTPHLKKPKIAVPVNKSLVVSSLIKMKSNKSEEMNLVKAPSTIVQYSESSGSGDDT